MTVVVAEVIHCHYFTACWYSNVKSTKYGWVSFWQCHGKFFSPYVRNFSMKPIQLTLPECDTQENQYFHLVMWHFRDTYVWIICEVAEMSKTLFIVPTDAHNYKIIGMLRTTKIPTTAPTCFGSRRNHRQGAILCLAKTTIMVLLCSSLMTWSMLRRHTSLLCKRAVHSGGKHCAHQLE